MCRYGKGIFFLGWHEIRQTLYESLPQGMVEFGRKFDCYEDHGAEGISVRFQVRCNNGHYAIAARFQRVDGVADDTGGVADDTGCVMRSLSYSRSTSQGA